MSESAFIAILSFFLFVGVATSITVCVYISVRFAIWMATSRRRCIRNCKPAEHEFIDVRKDLDLRQCRKCKTID